MNTVNDFMKNTTREAKAIGSAVAEIALIGGALAAGVVGVAIIFKVLDVVRPIVVCVF